MNSDKLPHPQMSQLAAKLMLTIVDSLDSEAAIRKSNREQWFSCLHEKKAYIHGSVEGAYTPYLAGISSTGVEEAKELFGFLSMAGIPVTTWPDLPPEVLSKPNQHCVALRWRKTKIFLPVHRSVDPGLIRTVIDRVKI